MRKGTALNQHYGEHGWQHPAASLSTGNKQGTGADFFTSLNPAHVANKTTKRPNQGGESSARSAAEEDVAEPFTASLPVSLRRLPPRSIFKEQRHARAA
jgi:hypothetical protein